MNTQIINTANAVVAVIILILSTIFCVLVLFVLVYYIRRRYKLYKEINRIPQELLIMESYRNHLKNLKITCVINNFIIVILVMEFLLYFGPILMYYPYVIAFLLGNSIFISLRSYKIIPFCLQTPFIIHLFLYYL